MIGVLAGVVIGAVLLSVIFVRMEGHQIEILDRLEGDARDAVASMYAGASERVRKSAHQAGNWIVACLAAFGIATVGGVSLVGTELVRSGQLIDVLEMFDGDSAWVGLGPGPGGGAVTPRQPLVVKGTDPNPEEGGGPSSDGTCLTYNGVAPFWEWNPGDYANTAAVLASSGAAPGGIRDSIALLTGQTLFDGSTGNVVEFVHSGSGLAEYANVWWSITGASSSATDTTWVEAWYRYSTNAVTGNTSDNKTHEVGTNTTRILAHLNTSGPNAWIDNPSDNSVKLYGGTVDEIYGSSYSRDTITFGGTGSDTGMSTWHRLRYYIADESPTGGDGALVVKLDSIMLFYNESSPPGDSVAGLSVNYTAAFSHIETIWPLGANHGWTGGSDVSMQAGANCVYTSDPGWSLVEGSDGLEGN